MSPILYVLVFLTAILGLEGIYAMMKDRSRTQRAASDRLAKIARNFQSPVVGRDDREKEESILRGRESDDDLIDRLLLAMPGARSVSLTLYRAGSATTLRRFLLTSLAIALAGAVAGAVFIPGRGLLFAFVGFLPWINVRRQKAKRMALFVSRYDHCLYDLLLRHRAGELAGEIPVIVSNHADLEPVATQFGIDYRVFPITTDTKAEQEKREAELLESLGVDVIVLARYMQVLSSNFVARYPERIINIHHSFLPAFIGGRPYHQAYERGVKLIGATAHYATTDLDEGPIIEQDVIRASHRDSVADLVRKGRDVERTVLARAVRAHLDDRVLVYGNKTVVFD